MKTVFIGASKFGLKCLEAIVQTNSCTISGVITAEETFKISYNPEGVKNVLYANFSSYCKDRNFDCEIMKSNMKSKEMLLKVKKWNPDAFIVCGWYHMIPNTWREIAPAYGLHASLLPDYSGGAPLVWAMINGEKETGITLFQMDSGVDSGPILAQKKVQIHSNDNISDLYKKIEECGIELLNENIPLVAQNKHKLIPQDESKRVIYPQRSPEDGKIDWKWSVSKIKNFIKAQTKPYPGAFTVINNKKITIWDADIEKVKGTESCD